MSAPTPALATDPFPTPPHPGVFFETEIHRGALSFIDSALRSEELFVLVTGEYGTGKTLLCLKFIQDIQKSRQTNYVYVSTPLNAYTETLRQGHRALGLGEPSQEMTNEQLLSRIYRHFEGGDSPQRLIILMEDPQDLDLETFNQIRFLANYNIHGHFPIRFFLFAHPSFTERLREPDLKPLDQRIKLRYNLTPLTAEETREYIYFRLDWAHLSDQMSIDHSSPYFLEPAVARIHELTQGIPRSINNLCGMSLRIAGSRGIVAIDRDIIEEAASYLHWEAPTARRPFPETEASQANPPEPNPADSPFTLPRTSPTQENPGAPGAAVPGAPFPEPPGASPQEDSGIMERGLDATSSFQPQGQQEAPHLGSRTPGEGIPDMGQVAPPRRGRLGTWAWRATVIAFILLILGVLIARNSGGIL